MKTRLAWTVAAGSVVGFLVWLARAGTEGSSVGPPLQAAVDESTALDRATGGSILPCDVPLAWRIARLDEEFELDEGDALAALEDAGSAWEEVLGRRLFAHDADAGFPVRFVFDDRQAETVEQRRLTSELEEELRALEGDRSQLEQMGETPGRRARMGVERERLARRAAELEGRAAELAERFPATAREAAVYREAYVEEAGGGSRRLSREIRIHRFTDPDDLRRVAAHELGHALGLGHSTSPDALMWAGPDPGGEPPVPVDRPGADDVARLRELCG